MAMGSGGSEFPKDWGREEICKAIEATLERGRPHPKESEVFIHTYKGVRMWVVTGEDSQGSYVVTAYPPDREK